MFEKVQTPSYAGERTTGMAEAEQTMKAATDDTPNNQKQRVLLYNAERAAAKDCALRGFPAGGDVYCICTRCLLTPPPH